MILTGRVLFPVYPADGYEAEAQLAAFTAHTGHRASLLANRLSRDTGKAQELLDATTRRLEERGVAVETTEVVSGNFADAVLRAAAEQDAAVIFMPAGPENRVDIRHTGVEAQTVARHAQRPVWIAKPHTPPELETILCAVDDRRACAEGLRMAIELARTYDARLRIVRVAHPPDENDPLTVNMTERERAEARQAAADHVEREFEEFLAGFRFDGVDQVDHDLRWSERASRALIDIAGEDPSALLVMGCAGIRRFFRPMLGTTSSRVLAEAPCSLLMVKF